MVRSDLAGRERPLRRASRISEATTWRLGGETPAYVRDIVVSESKPGRRAEAGVLRDGRVRGDRIERAFAHGGPRRSCPIRAIIAWMRMFRCWCRRSTRIILKLLPDQQQQTRMEGADRDQSELLDRWCW